MEDELFDYLKTHGIALLNALTNCKQEANRKNKSDDVQYWQHETNALLDILNKLTKK